MNPAHLSLGSIADNNADMVRKQRNVRGERASAKVTAEQVAEIRRLFSSGEATRYQLSAAYGVTHRQICYIVRGRSWKHVA